MLYTILVAGALGYWVYADARKLAGKDIKVGSFSPAAWGWLVFLAAIVFGIMYLYQRRKAILTPEGPRDPDWFTKGRSSPDA
jgi:hypothetical protein